MWTEVSEETFRVYVQVLKSEGKKKAGVLQNPLPYLEKQHTLVIKTNFFCCNDRD